MTGHDEKLPLRRYRIERARIGQGQAIGTILKKVKEDQRFISIVLPTRYGKSDVVRLTAFEMMDVGMIGGAMVLSPNGFLRNQIVNREKVEAMLDRYDASFSGRCIYGIIKTLVKNPNANGEWLVSATIQFIQRNLDIFGQWVESVYALTGKRAIIYIDEAHTGSTRNRWGDVARVLAQYGAIIVLLTATPYRADGDIIPGFQVEVMEEKAVRKWVSSEGRFENLLNIDVYDGSSRMLKLKADYEYSLKEAWREDPLPVAKIEWLPFAVELQEFAVGRELASKGVTLLSELSATAVRKNLGRIIRDPKVIERGVDVLVRKVRELKVREPRIVSIVFCGNDQEDDPDFNRHANLIRDMIQMKAPELRVRIATSVTDDGEQVIQAFSKDSGGDGDILVVKQMASVGLDCLPLKVALDLSPIRTAAAFVQRLMRIATIFRGFVGIYICVDEAISKSLFERFITIEGGEATVTDLELVDSYEKEREDKPKVFYSVNGTNYADFGDCDDIWADKELIHKVEAFRRMVPEVIGPLSHAAIAARIEAFGWEFRSAPGHDGESINTETEIFTLRKSINEKVRLITNLDRIRRGLTKESRETYGETIRSIYSRLYQVANVKFIELKNQNNIDILKKLDHAADLVMAYYNPSGEI